MSEDKNALTTSGGKAAVPSSAPTLTLSETEHLDLAGLTETQIAELRHQYAAGMIDIKRKAEELKVDVAALDATLQSLNHNTQKATESGAHITTTHTQTTSVGRTETIIGNTDRAATGKISRSAAGLPDNTMIYVIIGVAVALVIAFLAFAR